jgi:site-specific DNA-methyltransferase (adenine-specific)
MVTALTDARFDARLLFQRPVAPPAFSTALGALWAADCMEVLPAIASETVDTVFADPPFNIGKQYGARTNDAIADADYLTWCRAWLDECARVLKPGGALFVYNLPKWNVLLGAHLFARGLDFRHWIAIEISSSFPIAGRLHPSHYGLLYFTRGKPKTFRRIRTPIAKCRHCGDDLKDYGGHRGAMNPRGVTLKDVWTDIPPVRHWKFKSKARRANALSTKLLDRVVEMSTRPGDVVLDPFGGSGTTFAVCERKHRHWLGMEIDFAPEIAERITSDAIAPHANDDFVEG